ncbi:MAG: sulfatase [Candidatus Liptonbacteria bacterium]
MKPNLIFIYTDDQRLDDHRVIVEHVPWAKTLFADWLEFKRGYAPTHLCCPSRASVLTGLFEHNHSVYDNDPPKGGIDGFIKYGHEGDNIALRLRGGGYRTALFGKYLNDKNHAYVGRVPAGWDEWYGITVPTYPSSDQVDEMMAQLLDYVSRSNGQPFFAYVAPTVPHIPHVPAQRYKGYFGDLPFTPAPSVDEDMQDKNGDMQSRSRLGPNELNDIQTVRQQRLESLMIVYEMVQKLVEKLAAMGQLENTVIVFSSDNGWFYGEHRAGSGKAGPYEESVHMPFFVRMPGVKGGTREHPVTQVDIAPTFLEFAGLPIPPQMDGKSLVPLLSANPPSISAWSRPATPFEGIPWFQGMRYYDGTMDYVYIQNGAFEELYDVARDPYQLENLVYWWGIPQSSWPDSVRALRFPNTQEYASIRATFDRLARCEGEGCKY